MDFSSDPNIIKASSLIPEASTKQLHDSQLYVGVYSWWAGECIDVYDRDCGKPYQNRTGKEITKVLKVGDSFAVGVMKHWHLDFFKEN